jgi:hypothetical protein
MSENDTTPTNPSDPYGLGYDESPKPQFELSPETQQKIKDVKDTVQEKLPDPEQVKQHANRASTWIREHKEELKKAGIVVGVAYVAIKAKRRLNAVKAAKAVNDYAGATLLVTPEQAAQIHGFGKALRFDSELGAFVVQSATNLEA